MPLELHEKKREATVSVNSCKYFYNTLNCLGKIIKDNLCLLYINDEVKKVFSLKPMMSLRSTRRLSSSLVSAKLYPIERTVGSFNFTKKRCEVCKNVNITDSFIYILDYSKYI